jgi:hypothetical protein
VIPCRRGLSQDNGFEREVPHRKLFAEEKEVFADQPTTKNWNIRAPSAEAIRIAARRANEPADVIIEIGGELRPDMFA